MEVNYILIYGNPYLQTKYFEKFDDISEYLEPILKILEN